MKNFLLAKIETFLPTHSHSSGWISWLRIVFIIAVFVLFPLGQLGRMLPPFGGTVGAIYLHELPLVGAIFFSLPWLRLQASSYLRLLLDNFQRLFKNLTESSILSQLLGFTTSTSSKTKQYSKDSTKFLILVKSFLVWIFLGMSVAFISTLDFTPLLYAARIIGYILFLLVTGKVFKNAVFSLRVLLFLSGIWYWWLAVLQYLFVPDTRFLWLMGWDDHYYRMIGTLFDPGLTGILLVLTLIVTYSFRDYLKKWRPGWVPIVFLLIAVLLCSSVFVTFSRASYLSLITALLLLFYINYRGKFAVKKLFLGLSLGLISTSIIYAVIPKPSGEGVRLLRTSTITARLVSAKDSLSSMKGSDWIIGQGLFSRPVQHSESQTFSPSTITTTTTAQSGSSQAVSPNAYTQRALKVQNLQASQKPSMPTQATIPDNIFITLLTQTGVIGLLLGGTLIIYILKSLWKDQPLVAVAMIAVLMQSQFNNTALHPYIIFYLGLFAVSSYLRVTFRSTST